MLKYAKADTVDFFITFTKTHLEIEYIDNGIGFNVEEKVNNGFGLKSLKARTEAMHGKCNCFSTLGKGTKWHFTFLHKNLLNKSNF